jgi:hypothetical protein
MIVSEETAFCVHHNWHMYMVEIGYITEELLYVFFLRCAKNPVENTTSTIRACRLMAGSLKVFLEGSGVLNR